MRRLSFIIALVLGVVAGTARAEEFQLANGEKLTGELLPTSANDQGVQVKVGDGNYQKIPWTNFSQGDLKKFQSNQKLAPLVEPYVEITMEERIKKTDVGEIKEPDRLSRPAHGSFFGALFGSGLGWFLMLIVYAGIIYAGYEVALFRAQPVLLVAGLSAIPFLGVVAPIVFLAMPTRLTAGALAVAAEAAAAEGAAPAEGAAEGHVAVAGTAEAINPMQDTSAQHPTALHLATSAPAPSKSALPQAVVFQRGQFTFNRRFFETKFPGFFGLVRREAERDMLLLIKAVRGEYLVERITRMAGNDVHIEIRKGEASAEVMIPFQEIKEIQLKHKDAP